MIDEETFSAFMDEMVKTSGPGGNFIQRGLGAIGERVAPLWGKLDTAAEGLRTFGRGVASKDMSLGRKVLHGGARAAVGGAVGAGVGQATGGREGMTRGAIYGALGGAAAPMLVSGVHNVGVAAGRLAKNPVRQMQAAWKSQEATWRGNGAAGKFYKNVSKYAPDAEIPAQQIKQRYNSALAAAEENPGMWNKLRHGDKAKDVAKEKVLNKYKHLINPETGETIDAGRKIVGQGGILSGEGGLRQKMPEVFGELSRRGWTGQGGVTKYLPVGGKGQTAIFAGMSAPTIYGAATGDKPWSEAAGEMGSNVGFLAGAGMPGLGMVGTMGLSELARRGFAAPVKSMEGRPQIVPGEKVLHGRLDPVKNVLPTSNRGNA